MKCKAVYLLGMTIFLSVTVQAQAQLTTETSRSIAEKSANLNPDEREEPSAIILDSNMSARLLQGTSIMGSESYAQDMIPLAAGWEIILFEGFEGAWPGPWITGDDNATSGADYWGDVDCKPGGAHNGSWTGWCADEGDMPVCGSSYDNDMSAWMIYGPFSLEDATAAEVEFYFVNECEPSYDGLGYYVSINGTNFYGNRHSGTTTGYPDTWQQRIFDLTNVYTLGDLTGQPQVWFAFNFDSDDTLNSYRGAYVDDITIRRYTSEPTSEIHGSKWNDLNGDGIWDVGEPGLENWKIYLDENINGQWDSNESYYLTDADGTYAFTGLEAGTYVIGEVLQDGWEQTYPAQPGAASQQEGTSVISQITTTGSKVPIYKYGEVVPPEPGRMLPLTAESGSLINMEAFRSDPQFSGIDGSGYAAVILDTGIDLDHPYFGPDNNIDGVADRIVFHHDFADNDDDATDYNGHGSNVSSIIASQDPAHTGMAPAVDIIHLKVFSDDDSGNFGITEQALQWVVSNAETYNIVSVNMSLGDSLNWNSAISLYGIGDELAALSAMGVIVCSASGNDFFTFSSQQGVSYPSADPNSLSIGAVYDAATGLWSYSSGATAFSSGADRITPFSQRHATLTTIMAPGAVITGANESGGTVNMHGTSQASPHIAGIAVLAQQLAESTIGRRLTTVEFANLLAATGVTVNDGDDEDDNVTNTSIDFMRVDMLSLARAIAHMASEETHLVTLDPGEVATDINFGNRIAPAADSDEDGVPDDEDNCPNHPNSPESGSCVRTLGGMVIGTGVVCTDDGDCGGGEACQMVQEDCNDNGMGDVCECYADTNCDTTVNLTDLVKMKQEYFRTDCATTPCDADCNGDDQVNLTDLVIMKAQYFRSDCPVCP